MLRRFKLVQTFSPSIESTTTAENTREALLDFGIDPSEIDVVAQNPLNNSIDFIHSGTRYTLTSLGAVRGSSFSEDIREEEF